MKRCLRLVFFLTLVHLSLDSTAQEVFEVDSITNKVNKELPFDRPFILKVPDKDRSVKIIRIYRIQNKRDTVLLGRPGALNNARDMDSKGLKFDRLKDNILIQVPSLRPNRDIEIRLFHSFEGNNLDELFGVFQKYDNGQLEDGDKLLDQLLSRIEPDMFGEELTSFGARSWVDSDDNDLNTFFKDNLKLIFDEVKTKNFSLTLSEFSNTNMELVENRGSLILKLNTEKLRAFWRLDNQGLLSDFENGRLVIESTQITSKVPEFSLVKRSSNLTKNVKFMNELLAELDDINARDGGVLTELDNMISQLRSAIITFETNRKWLSDKLKAIKTIIDSEKNIMYSDWYTGGNQIPNLKSAGSYSIIPEIGLAGIYANGHSTDELLVRPYIGVGIYFRPVDKNIPFSNFSNSFWHRASIDLGLTVSKLNTGDGQSEFSDLYNNMSVLTGVKYKATRAVSFSMGFAWTQQIDSNPLIDDKSIVALPYLSLSLDVDFASALSKLTGKVGL